MPMEKQGEWGDAWTFVAIDADTKVVPCWMIGERTMLDAMAFLTDLKDRMRSRIQLTADGHKMYAKAVPGAFGMDVDYAMLVKVYGPDWVRGPALQMGMGMRRMTRLTNAFSKKLETLIAAEALHFIHHNFARPHKTLSRPYPTTPGMASGVADHVWTLEEIAAGLLA